MALKCAIVVDKEKRKLKLAFVSSVHLRQFFTSQLGSFLCTVGTYFFGAWHSAQGILANAPAAINELHFASWMLI